MLLILIYRFNSLHFQIFHTWNYRKNVQKGGFNSTLGTLLVTTPLVCGQPLQHNNDN